MFPLPPFYYFEFAALFASIYAYRRNKGNFISWFPFYLSFIILAELTGRFIRKVHHDPNVWVYNLSIPIEYLFYATVFYVNMTMLSGRYLAKWFIVLFAGFALLNITVIQGLSQLNTNILMVGSFFMILLSGLMFFDIYKNDRGLNIWQLPIFWIALGVLLFNAGEFSYDLLSTFLVFSEFDKGAKFFAEINNKLIFVLYSCLIIGFLCSRITAISKKA